MSEIEDSGQDRQQEKTDSSHSNYIDLASLDDTWNRLQIRQRERFTLWGTVDRWGPGAIAILTLMLVAVIGWMYSAELAKAEAEIDAIRLELQNIRDDNRETLRLIAVDRMTQQKLREDLLKKGVIN